MKITKSSLDQIQQQAIQCYPAEACGLIIREGRAQVYVPCTNVATTPGEHFRLAPAEYAAAEDRGTVLAVVHSHPDYSPQPSEADRVACEASGLPWHIIEVRKGDDGAVTAGELFSFAPTGYQAPLIGRSFHHGSLDCYQMIVDYYQRELGIALKQYGREDDWWSNGGNLYMENYADAGFSPVNDLQQGDVIIMQVRAPVPNHAGIYLADGILKTEPEHYPAPGSLLHHLYGRDGRRDIYGAFWAESTRLILRHKDAKQ
ncbi:C40 family peptidase [Pseudomonas abietaniphila]|uniref:Proteasome lid subunit RPN8/RPN11, contains Jab1/MPN metalloenzyme (JAMM) motif n=1 Tax=Pseudomonas abietaniphila TaxID=89065 RepID=A0A1G8T971_9PSED|nr:Mov34/MPN/PAD-1 family protein [Pseudomonas abietaniphila]SDJ37981.1 Proteasome lid subunit RPN8/RPN11, contains Jab1/MPN metalloenzyme (JAMM) motif [Pseudomonas abietaniphila]